LQWYASSIAPSIDNAEGAIDWQLVGPEGRIDTYGDASEVVEDIIKGLTIPNCKQGLKDGSGGSLVKVLG
jgi:hypothetical protein